MNYNGQKGNMYPPLSLRSLEERWQDIKEQVGKFKGYYNVVLCENRSGFIDSDKTAAAVTLYNRMKAKPFTVVHCWEILHNQPKWTDLHEKTAHEGNLVDSSPAADLSDSVPRDQDSSSVAGNKRPLGRDSSKAAKKALSSESGSQSTADFTSLLSEMHVEKMSLLKASEGEVSANIDKLVSIEEKKVQLKEKRDEREATKEDERIIAVDLSTCNPGQRMLYEAMQHEMFLFASVYVASTALIFAFNN
ncbi:hypothetical protein BAE44_0007070 [Dichanthelium oligosanthes]|uniref:No apical meristem-associated C-terminal domain-containing protein n=1 Tax=Dichanthelium oligosanthes TaxID=888268 RepID=A0A1E5W3B9_9POAL|nr:hypothetical protein BAE44_0007070 [Dichanthelium oligosanthes]